MYPLVQIGPFRLSSGGLVLLLSLILGGSVMARVARARGGEKLARQADNCFYPVLIGATIGARLWYGLFNLDLYGRNPGLFVALRVSDFAWPGALLGGALAGYVLHAGGAHRFGSFGVVVTPSAAGRRFGRSVSRIKWARAAIDRGAARRFARATRRHPRRTGVRTSIDARCHVLGATARSKQRPSDIGGSDADRRTPGPTVIGFSKRLTGYITQGYCNVSRLCADSGAVNVVSADY